ncbi:hypothetical protein CYMTET_42552 [Cymbomonas tetramitiformis]|uniref:Uncharacterized protein n=1 Tax=Cymbomonas tetramitiformis TaxID=36881 RepID=A0AAE0C616_9CHLO|nr:hypothetical protein CYMTET_42552 [Cymbomonas tetramitiformis]
MCTLGEILKGLQLAIDNLNKANALLVEQGGGGSDTYDCCEVQTAKMKQVQRDVWYEYKDLHSDPDNIFDPLFCEGCRGYYYECKHINEYTTEDCVPNDPLGKYE